MFTVIIFRILVKKSLKNFLIACSKAEFIKLRRSRWNFAKIFFNLCGFWYFYSDINRVEIVLIRNGMLFFP